MKKWLKNQKGLTLVELLAVIVILGIIAAIAVPAIGNIIENSRKDAQIANAEALYDAARLAQAGDNISGDVTFVAVNEGSISENNVTVTDSDDKITLVDYIEPAFAESDPHSDNYYTAEIEVDDNDYKITLIGDDDGSAGETYFNGISISDIREKGRDGFDGIEFTN